MPTETITTQPDWTSLQGTLLEGGYELTEIIQADQPTATFKVRVLGDHLLRAQVNFYRMEEALSEDQLALWERAKELPHRSLCTPLASGRLSHDGLSLVYAIFPRPDETLAGVLQERALSREEAGELLQSLLAGLERLHAEQLVHGCVSPGQILAVGDLIQLSTEPIRVAGSPPPLHTRKPVYVAPESEGENVAVTADVWCVGATLYQALTQKLCGEGSREDAARLPAPFSTVIQRCLHPDPTTRVKLAEVATLSKQRNAPVPPAKPVPAISPTPAVSEKPGRVPERAPEKMTSALKPAVGSTLAAASAIKGAVLKEWTRLLKPPRSPAVRAAIYATVGLIVFFGLIWMARPRPHLPPKSAAQEGKASAPQVAATLPHGSSTKSWQTRTLSPDGTSEKSAGSTRLSSAAADAASRSVRSANSGVWRVIVYTYLRSEDAKEKAKSINAKHPDLNAQEFSPKGDTGPHLVTLGGGLTNREDATRLRQKALHFGLPHDTYVQNYKQ